jgi:hypothetical protein
VNSRQRSIWLLLGLLASTGAGLSLAPTPAAAQIFDPPSRVETRPVRPKPPPEAPDPSLLPDDQVPVDTGFAPDFGTTTVTPADAQDGIDPQDSASQELEAREAQDAAATPGAEETGDTDEFGEARTRPRRLPPQDGDLPTVLEEAAPSTEGIVDLNAPSTPPNEEDVTLADMRNARDLTLFVGTAAGYDPLLLEAQETNPVFSNIATFDPDPFVPLGTRIGSFLLFLALESDGDYNSNVFASPEALGDYSLEVRPSVRLASTWGVHALELRASGDLSFHDKFETEDDRAYLVEALSRLDITRRANVQFGYAHEEAQESRSAINATDVGTRPDIVVNRARLSGNYTFNRLTLQLRGALIDTRYGNDIVDGEVESNEDRDYTLYEQAFRPQWEFKPNLYLFSDISINQRDYPLAAFTDGLNRTSEGERYRVGLWFGALGEYLRGSASVGYGRQVYDNPQLIPIDGFLFDADLTWRVSAVTSLLFTAATDIAETTTNDAGGVLERTYAVQARHSFSTRLIGSLGATYLNRDFVGGDLTEQQSSEAAGLEYYLSREYVLFGRYAHTNFYTTAPNGDYSVEEMQLGLRIRH